MWFVLSSSCFSFGIGSSSSRSPTFSFSLSFVFRFTFQYWLYSKEAIECESTIKINIIIGVGRYAEFIRFVHVSDLLVLPLHFPHFNLRKTIEKKTQQQCCNSNERKKWLVIVSAVWNKLRLSARSESLLHKQWTNVFPLLNVVSTFFFLRFVCCLLPLLIFL